MSERWKFALINYTIHKQYTKHFCMARVWEAYSMSHLKILITNENVMGIST